MFADLFSNVTSSSLYGYGFCGFCGRFISTSLSIFFRSRGITIPACLNDPFTIALSLLIFPVYEPPIIWIAIFRLSSVIVIDETGMLLAPWSGLSKNAPSEPSLLSNILKTIRRETEEIFSVPSHKLVNFFSSFF